MCKFTRVECRILLEPWATRTRHASARVHRTRRAGPRGRCWKRNTRKTTTVSRTDGDSLGPSGLDEENAVTRSFVRSQYSTRTLCCEPRHRQWPQTAVEARPNCRLFDAGVAGCTRRVRQLRSHGWSGNGLFIAFIQAGRLGLCSRLLHGSSVGFSIISSRWHSRPPDQLGAWPCSAAEDWWLLSLPSRARLVGYWALCRWNRFAGRGCGCACFSRAKTGSQAGAATRLSGVVRAMQSAFCVFACVQVVIWTARLFP